MQHLLCQHIRLLCFTSLRMYWVVILTAKWWVEVYLLFGNVGSMQGIDEGSLILIRGRINLLFWVLGLSWSMRLLHLTILHQDTLLLGESISFGLLTRNFEIVVLLCGSKEVGDFESRVVKLIFGNAFVEVYDFLFFYSFPVYIR